MPTRRKYKKNRRPSSLRFSSISRLKVLFTTSGAARKSANAAIGSSIMPATNTRSTRNRSPKPMSSSAPESTQNRRRCGRSPRTSPAKSTPARVKPPTCPVTISFQTIQTAATPTPSARKNFASFTISTTINANFRRLVPVCVYPLKRDSKKSIAR